MKCMSYGNLTAIGRQLYANAGYSTEVASGVADMNCNSGCTVQAIGPEEIRDPESHFE